MAEIQDKWKALDSYANILRKVHKNFQLGQRSKGDSNRDVDLWLGLQHIEIAKDRIAAISPDGYKIALKNIKASISFLETISSYSEGEPLGGFLAPEPHPGRLIGYWTIIRVQFTIQPSLSTLRMVFASLSITGNMVCYIYQSIDRKSWNLVVDTMSIGRVQAELERIGCSVELEFNPIGPEQIEVDVYGKLNAQKRAKYRFFSIAEDAIRSGLGSGFREFLETLLEKNQLQSEFSRYLQEQEG